MRSRLGFNRSGLNALNRLLAIVVLLAGGGCASPSVPVEPVRVAFLFEGTAVTALPIGSGRLLTVAHGVPVSGESVAAVTTATGWRSTGLVRVIDRGPPAGEAAPLEIDIADEQGSAILDRDWSILWFEPGSEPSGAVGIVDPVVGDRVTIRGFSQESRTRPVSIRGEIVQLSTAEAGAARSFLVRPTRGAQGTPGLSGSPVFLERRIGGQTVLLLGGMFQACAETDGPLDGLLRCVAVPREIEWPTEPHR
jgi:hypothetical protein